MSDEETILNTKALDDLTKVLKENKYIVKVGILGNKNSRNDGQSNAMIGACHEFGTINIPRRSFLRMPLETQFPKELEKLGGLDEKSIQGIIKDVSLKKYMEQLGIIAVATILKAFDTSGFGTWEALNPIYLKARVRQNQGTQILVRVKSHQLRDSITYKVKKVK